ncbi:hypothetical protein A2160_01540 [Candidatus Beckwithbacteria bacterium RBG_13_42_9]|uniref:Uncharacterized protein n=1 Tax=Candidatus Beckwithbacteria bacterium RBG_13_42_9 TaxID=1797457 RepID=A0A1F5E959_9BACT|nr:MAG: hypothetical protein A2160_01540 [Candidatus Beckwithbacteria bacterium RBG_13_42_9]
MALNLSEGIVVLEEIFDGQEHSYQPLDLKSVPEGAAAQILGEVKVIQADQGAYPDCALRSCFLMGPCEYDKPFPGLVVYEITSAGAAERRGLIPVIQG